jgi:tetratricopeptide (TPR) repeat protein
MSTIPKVINDERKANLYNRANHYRRQNEFDKAIQAYENILNEDSSDAEAHWGIVLSRYGIEYVEDPSSGQRIPTCHRVQSDSVLNDADYLACLQHAPDEYTRSLYEEEAKKISEIQRGILSISNKEEPYDVFICYKETTEGGSRTKDSTFAQDIYYQLTKDGYKVFFSRITLEDKVGRDYEPYIFSALNSAKVMLVICTNKDYIQSVWVRNEWSRYFALTKKDSSRLLVPCYKDIDPYDDLPGELSALQGFDMSKVGFMHDLTHTVKKVLDRGKVTDKTTGETVVVSTVVAPGVESLMKRGWLFLEDSDWKQADEYFDKVLDIDPEHAPAYIGKMCAELQIKYENDLSKYSIPLVDMSNFKKAVRFADDKYKTVLTGYNQTILDRIRAEYEQQLLDRYNELIKLKQRKYTENGMSQLAQDFHNMKGYKDTAELALECEKKYYELKQEREEQERIDMKNSENRKKERDEKIKRAIDWRNKGLCWHCGGKTGIFNSTCKSCKKSYSDCFLCGGSIEFNAVKRVKYCSTRGCPWEQVT